MGLFDNSELKFGGDSNSPIGKAIDNYVNSDLGKDYSQTGNNNKWQDLGMSALKGLGNISFSQGGGKNVIFNPVMAQPQYLNTQFNTNPSNIANGGNLYNYLVR